MRPMIAEIDAPQNGSWTPLKAQVSAVGAAVVAGVVAPARPWRPGRAGASAAASGAQQKTPLALPHRFRVQRDATNEVVTQVRSGFAGSHA